MLAKINNLNPINNCNITIKITKITYNYQTAAVCVSPTVLPDYSNV